MQPDHVLLVCYSLKLNQIFKRRFTNGATLIICYIFFSFGMEVFYLFICVPNTTFYSINMCKNVDGSSP